MKFITILCFIHGFFLNIKISLFTEVEFQICDKIPNENYMSGRGCFLLYTYVCIYMYNIYGNFFDRPRAL